MFLKKLILILDQEIESVNNKYGKLYFILLKLLSIYISLKYCIEIWNQQMYLLDKMGHISLEI